MAGRGSHAIQVKLLVQVRGSCNVAGKIVVLVCWSSVRTSVGLRIVIRRGPDAGRCRRPHSPGEDSSVSVSSLPSEHKYFPRAVVIR